MHGASFLIWGRQPWLDRIKTVNLKNFFGAVLFYVRDILDMLKAKLSIFLRGWF